MSGGTETVLNDVRNERVHQLLKHRFTPEHDDAHARGELARAGLNYAAAATDCLAECWARYDSPQPPFLYGLGFSITWPFDLAWWKPGAVRPMLIKAIALLVAEVERIDRVAERAR